MRKRVAKKRVELAFDSLSVRADPTIREPGTAYQNIGELGALVTFCRCLC